MKRHQTSNFFKTDQSIDQNLMQPMTGKSY